MKLTRSKSWYYVNGFSISAKALNAIFSEFLSNESWGNILTALNRNDEVNLTNIIPRDIVPNCSAKEDAYEDKLESLLEKDYLIEKKLLEVIIRNLYLEKKLGIR